MRNPSIYAASAVMRRLSLALRRRRSARHMHLCAGSRQAAGRNALVHAAYSGRGAASCMGHDQAIMGPNTAIPPKYKELIGLAVASQIPCQYCIYGHTKGAEKDGATTDEIREAIAVGALIRMWSTVVQGNQTDFAKFKATVDGVSQ